MHASIAGSRNRWPSPGLIQHRPLPLSVGAWVQRLLWACFIIASPFYVFPSGQPQPADWVLLAAVLSALSSHLSKSAVESFIYCAWPALAFAAYALLITSYWTWRLGDERMLLHPAYYAFNALAFAALLRTSVRQREKFLHIVGYAFAVSMVLQVGLVISGFQPGVRATASLNNPNQLGYFGLLGATVLVLLTNIRATYILPRWVTSLGLAAAFWLTMLSLSKAATLGVALLCAMVVRTRPAVAGGVVALGVALTYVIDIAPVAGALHNRVTAIGKDPDDSFEARGYDRIWKFPENLVFGAGEGAYYRFGRGAEMHSTLGTILFSYGVPGTTLFLLFLYRIYRIGRWGLFQWMGPALLYGVTHQGLRFTELWLTLGVIASLGILGARRRICLGWCHTADVRATLSMHGGLYL